MTDQLPTGTEAEAIAPYYRHQFAGRKLDVYRVLLVFGITHPAQQHAIKKLLRAGRGHKPLEQDIQEVIDSLKRWQEMLKEDAALRAFDRVGRVD